jgi:hypothetical protein
MTAMQKENKNLQLCFKNETVKKLVLLAYNSIEYYSQKRAN